MHITVWHSLMPGKHYFGKNEGSGIGIIYDAVEYSRMSMKGVMLAVLLMAFMLSAVCISAVTSDVAAEEEDDAPMVFVIDGRGHNHDTHPELNRINQTMRIIGEFELVSERMGPQHPNQGAYLEYQGMDEMSPMDRDMVKDMAHLVGLKGFSEGGIPGCRSVAVSFEQHDLDTIGTHDPEFISKAVEYLETESEYDDVAEVLEQIVTYNQANIEYLGREISCADTRASGDQDDEEVSEEDIRVVDSESDADVQDYEPIDSNTNAFSSAAAVFIETSFVDFKL